MRDAADSSIWRSESKSDGSKTSAAQNAAAAPAANRKSETAAAEIFSPKARASPRQTAATRIAHHKSAHIIAAPLLSERTEAYEANAAPAAQNAENAMPAAPRRANAAAHAASAATPIFRYAPAALDRKKLP